MKTILTLYIDAEVKEIAKSKGINLSQAFNSFLSIENELMSNKKKKSPQETISLLKTKIALVSEELNKAKSEIKSLKKRIKPPKERYISTGLRITGN